ncbi:WD repeat and HMG-box DNA-binding protein 1-like [Diadema antillarum]|uniref:WD repeat and HMG-box DNA-binding protein 1-like n=1 Tax=Diadema antillarum TaxID=105358 RepID=UPI003A8AF5BD
MVLIAPAMRMGHSEGHTDVCYEETGKFILTCGTDGDVRVWQGLDDDDPQTIDVGETSAALALSKGRLYIASDTNTVQAYTFPEGQYDGIISRFTAPVTHISFSSNCKKLAAGASDFNIKVTDIDDSSQKVLEGHTAPVISVAVDPMLDYVASSSCDGTMKIWSLAEGSWEKSAVLIPKCSDVSLSKTLCRLSWEPVKGQFLAVPLEKEIQIFTRDSWDLAFSLKPEEAGGFVSVVAWSPCGKFLASAGTDGTLCIWDVGSRKCLERTKHKKGLAICGLAWNPKGNQEIVFTDIMGQVGVFEGVVPASQSAPVTQEVTDDMVADLFDDAADEDLLEAAARMEEDEDEAEKENLLGANDDDDDDDDPIHADIRRAKQRVSMLLGQTDGVDGASNTGETDNASDITDIAPPKISAPPAAPVTPMQKPFIPASTPVHLSSRFMKWNAIGIVRCYDNDEESSIDVEFHDTAIHHSLHFDNQSNYTMAELGIEAVLLAAESYQDNLSLLMCYHFSSWDNHKEWSTTMPEGENIKALAVGEGWVAVATDKRLVRLYTTSGIQLQVFSLPGPVVCVAAHGKQLMLAFHAGLGLPGDQCIRMKLMTVHQKQSSMAYEGQLPLNPKTAISWFGFSAEGTAACVDSDGMVRLFNHALKCWTQVANTKKHCKGRSDHYWVVGIHENLQQLRCISCKGATFPPTLPRPAVTVLPLKLPMCEMTTEKGQMEEAYWRAQLLSQHFKRSDDVDEMARARMDREQQDNAMKLFALACRSDREFRAYDVCQFMTSHHSLSLAIKYASRSRRMILAQRLSDMASRLLASEEDEEDDEEEEEEVDVGFTHTRSAIRHGSTRRAPAENPNHRQHSRHLTTNGDVDEDEDDENDDAEEEENEEEEMETREEPTEKVLKLPKPKPAKIPSLLPSSQGRKNPFKKEGEKSGTAARGTSVFDEIKKVSPDRKVFHEKNDNEGGQKRKGPGANKQKKTKTQATLFAAKPKAKQEPDGQSERKSAKQGAVTFNTWLTQNRASLTEENPDLGPSEIIKLAMQKWKTLSAEEKEGLENKTKTTLEQSTPEDKSENRPAEKKRKRSEMEETAEKRKVGRIKQNDSDSKKQPLSVSTNAKLASFAFGKD